MICDRKGVKAPLKDGQDSPTYALYSLFKCYGAYQSDSLKVSQKMNFHRAKCFETADTGTTTSTYEFQKRRSPLKGPLRLIYKVGFWIGLRKVYDKAEGSVQKQGPLYRPHAVGLL